MSDSLNVFSFHSSSSSLGGDAATVAAATTAAAAGSGSFPSASPPFVEAAVPMWRKMAVPGALALGAVGALGTYYAASRSAGGAPSQSAGSRQSELVPHPPSSAIAAAAGDGYEYRAAGPPQDPDIDVAALEDNPGGGPIGGVDYAQDSFHSSQRVEPPGAGEPSALAGEFRRLTETMEQQTGHLVEAVGAMKALASRAEQDSSSLLAARISSHTSELRAELGNIKQLLLLQAGGAGGGGAAGDAHSGASGAVGAKAGEGAGPVDAALTSAEVAKNGTENGHLKAAAGGVEEAAADQGKPVDVSEVPTKSPEETAKEGADLGREGGAAGHFGHVFFYSSIALVRHELVLLHCFLCAMLVK